jgi:hypothetical protein
MAQVVKQVISSQNFLSGLLALPQYAELRAKQVERLLVIFRGSKLSLDQAGPVLKVLDERIWDCESLGRLKSALADQTVEEINDPEKRAKAQDYSALPFYVPEDLWLCLEKVACAEEREKRCNLFVIWLPSWDCGIPLRKLAQFCMCWLSPCIQWQWCMIAKRFPCFRSGSLS